MVRVEKPTKEKLEQLGAEKWPIWTKEVSVFEWYYDETEICYILEGEAEVKTEDGKIYHIEPGDLVTFQRGLKCVWSVRKPIRKHYNFLRS